MADPVGIVMAVGACARLANLTYRKCRDCPGEFQTLRAETNALKTTLEDLEDLIREHELTEQKEQECWERARDCKDVLEDLEIAVDRFRSLGESGRRAFSVDGVRWDREAAHDLRHRLNTTVTLLNAFYSRLIASSQVRIERALLTLLEEMRNGRRDKESVCQLAKTNGAIDDSTTWPTIVKDLAEVGINGEMADENRQFIIDWFVRWKPSLLPEEPEEPEKSEEPEEPEKPDAQEQESPPPPPLPPPPSSPYISDEPASTTRTSSSLPRTSTSYETTIGTSAPPSAVTVDLQLLEPYGKEGNDVFNQIHRGNNTFRDDLNRAREYWKRRNWFEVKKHLLRVLSAALLPRHRGSDISARTAAFLSGVAYSYSGDLEKAKLIMVSVLRPLDTGTGEESSNDLPTGSSDAGQVAAATWLGDLCMKTNRIENAAFAWALAYESVLRKPKTRERTGSSPVPPIHVTDISKEPNAPPSPTTPTLPHRLRPTRTHGSSPDHTELQARIILRRLAYCQHKTNNLTSLMTSLEEGWDLDSEESIFAHANLMSTPQMIRVAALALSAVERADSSLLSDQGLAKGVHTRLRSTSNARKSSSPTSTEPAMQLPQYLSPIVPADDFLTSPVRWPPTSTAWPIEWDPEFHLQSALKTIDWYFSFTPLAGEGLFYNLETVDTKNLKEHSITTFAKDLDAKQTESFKKTLQRLVKSLGFHQKEQPGSFRCLNGTNTWSRYPSIASFELRVLKYRPDGIMRHPKLAAYVCNILHWDNSSEKYNVDHDETKNLLSEMRSRIKIYEAESKGLLLPTYGPDIAAQIS